MAITLTHVGRTPGQTQFVLDTFTEHYKANEAADVVLAGTTVPDTQMIAVHPDYQFMFVTARYVSETGEKSSALDVTYTGCIRETGGEDSQPALPSAQNVPISDAVMSATSSIGMDGTVLSAPVTAQYYAPTTQKTFFTYGSPGERGSVADPDDAIRIINITNVVPFDPGSGLDGIITNFFIQLIIDTLTSTEVVATKFWQNTERKTKTLTGWPFSVTPGDYIIMYSPGSGYSVGNNLVVTDGTYTAVLVVASIGIGGSVVSWTVTSNTFNYTTLPFGPLFASGGSGHGAGFYNIHVA